MWDQMLFPSVIIRFMPPEILKPSIIFRAVPTLVSLTFDVTPVAFLLGRLLGRGTFGLRDVGTLIDEPQSSFVLLLFHYDRSLLRDRNWPLLCLNVFASLWVVVHEAELHGNPELLAILAVVAVRKGRVLNHKNIKESLKDPHLNWVAIIKGDFIFLSGFTYPAKCNRWFLNQ